MADDKINEASEMIVDVLMQNSDEIVLSHVDRPSLIRRIAAVLESMLPQRSVKTLIWEEGRIFNMRDEHVFTVFNKYSIIRRANGSLTATWYDRELVEISVETMEQGKSLCQAEYERRVLEFFDEP